MQKASCRRNSHFFTWWQRLPGWQLIYFWSGFGWVRLEKVLVNDSGMVFVDNRDYHVCIKVADICPRKTFSETIRHRWYLPPDLNIGETRVWRLDFSGQIYNPVYLQFKIPSVSY